jgi:alanine-synthesizing transaminase
LVAKNFAFKTCHASFEVMRQGHSTPRGGVNRIYKEKELRNGTFRIETFPPYVLKKVQADMKAARQQGRDVIGFGMGIPDGKTPQIIVDAMTEAAQQQENQQYPEANGHPELLAAIGRLYERDYGFFPADDEKFVVPGVKPGIGHFCYGAFYPGTSVLAPATYYPIHEMGPKLAEADVTTYSMAPDGDHVRAIAHAYEAADRQPRCLIANFPHNPTGAIMEYDELAELVNFASHPDRDLYILYDAAYQRTVFGRTKAASILQVPGARKRCMEMWSFSKALDMSGWRMGFAIGNDRMVQALASVDSYLLYGVPSFIQIAGAAGLDHLDEFTPSICERYHRRDIVMAEAFTAAGWPMQPAKSTMFKWSKIPPQYAQMGSFAFARKLLDEADIAASPGKGFGEAGEGYMRFSLNVTEDRIREAAMRIKLFLAKG